MQTRRHTRRAFSSHSIVRMLPFGGLAVVIGLAACQRTDEVAPPPVRQVTVSPTSAFVVQGSTELVVATVKVSDPSTSVDVVWSLQGDGCAGVSCGTISFVSADAPDLARYEAPAVVPDPPVVAMTATSTADSSKSAVARITIGPTPISVTVDPSTPMEVHAGQSVSYVATVTGDSSQAGVSWAFYYDPWGYDSPCGNNCGYFSSTTTGSGQTMTFTVGPASGFPSYPFPITLIASSITDPTKSRLLKIDVVGP